MFDRAPLRVRPAEGEPPGWLFQRLAHRNGFEDTSEFAKCFRTSEDDIRRGMAGERLAKLSGISESVLSAWSPRDQVTVLELRGQTLRTPYDWAGGMPGKPVRACPECLQADLAERSGPKASRPFVRAWWCLRDIYHCHVHGGMLVERTADPARPFASNGSRRGGAKPFWVDFVGTPPEPVAGDDTLADRYLLGRLGLLPTEPHAVLDSLTFGEASAVVSWLGELAVSGADAMDVRSLPFREAMRVRSAGFALASDWPARILVRLQEVVEDRLETENGMGGFYGRFYKRLYDDRMMRDGHAGRDILRRLLERHALENVPFGRNDTLFRRPVEGSKRVNLVHAAKIADVTTHEFGKIAEALGVLEPGRTASDRWGVTREAAERVRAARAGTVRAGRLAEVSGIDVDLIDEMRVRGFIDPVWPIKTNPSVYLYPADVIGGIGERLAAMQLAYPKRRWKRRTKMVVTDCDIPC